MPMDAAQVIALAIAFVGIVGACYGIVRLWRRTLTMADRKARALAITNQERPHQ